MSTAVSPAAKLSDWSWLEVSQRSESAALVVFGQEYLTVRRTCPNSSSLPRSGSSSLDAACAAVGDRRTTSSATRAVVSLQVETRRIFMSANVSTGLSPVYGFQTDVRLVRNPFRIGFVRRARSDRLGRVCRHRDGKVARGTDHPAKNDHAGSHSPLTGAVDAPHPDRQRTRGKPTATDLPGRR